LIFTTVGLEHILCALWMYVEQCLSGQHIAIMSLQKKTTQYSWMRFMVSMSFLKCQSFGLVYFQLGQKSQIFLILLGF